MAGFHPAMDALPEVFPIFPLEGVLLLPRGRLPLNIFEPRYLAMIEDALGAGRMLAMVQPDGTKEASPSGPHLYSVGCLGRISSFSETEDSRMLITLTGVIRCEMASELDMRRGYRRMRGDYDRFVEDLSLEDRSIGIDRQRLLDALRGYFLHRKLEANWDAIKRIPDDMLVVTIAMTCPFEPVEKQALLEAPTVADRAATLLALLQMGAATPDDAGAGGHRVS